MSINYCVEITVFLCSICFSIYAKMQGFSVKCVLPFMQKLKMATKNGGKTIFGEKNCQVTADNLGIKHFPEIALSRTVSEINAFLGVMQKFKMATKNGRIMIFRENSPVHSANTIGVKMFRLNRSMSHRFREKCVFLFYTEIQDGHQKWRENILLENIH